MEQLYTNLEITMNDASVLDRPWRDVETEELIEEYLITFKKQLLSLEYRLRDHFRRKLNKSDVGCLIYDDDSALQNIVEHLRIDMEESFSTHEAYNTKYYMDAELTDNDTLFLLIHEHSPKGNRTKTMEIAFDVKEKVEDIYNITDANDHPCVYTVPRDSDEISAKVYSDIHVFVYSDDVKQLTDRVVFVTLRKQASTKVRVHISDKLAFSTPFFVDDMQSDGLSE